VVRRLLSDRGAVPRWFGQVPRVELLQHRQSRCRVVCCRPGDDRRPRRTTQSPPVAPSRRRGCRRDCVSYDAIHEGRSRAHLAALLSLASDSWGSGVHEVATMVGCRGGGGAGCVRNRAASGAGVEVVTNSHASVTGRGPATARNSLSMNSLMPSANDTCARKPREVSASAGLAKMWRMSPSR